MGLNDPRAQLSIVHPLKLSSAPVLRSIGAATNVRGFVPSQFSCLPLLRRTLAVSELTESQLAFLGFLEHCWIEWCPGYYIN